MSSRFDRSPYEGRIKAKMDAIDSDTLKKASEDLVALIGAGPKSPEASAMIEGVVDILTRCGFENVMVVKKALDKLPHARGEHENWKINQVSTKFNERLGIKDSAVVEPRLKRLRSMPSNEAAARAEQIKSMAAEPEAEPATEASRASLPDAQGSGPAVPSTQADDSIFKPAISDPYLVLPSPGSDPDEAPSDLPQTPAVQQTVQKKEGDAEEIILTQPKADAVDEAPEGDINVKDLLVMEADLTEAFQEQVLHLYKKYFGITDALRGYVRGEQRCRTWILKASGSPTLLAASTVRMNPYCCKSWSAWAQVLYMASSKLRGGFGKVFISGLEELLWQEQVDLYGLHSMRGAVDFWARMGLEQEVTLLGPEEHERKGSHRRWIAQSDSQGILPMFAKRLLRPYTRPYLEDDECQTSRDESKWKKGAEERWPAWRLLPIEKSCIDAEDLISRTELLMESKLPSAPTASFASSSSPLIRKAPAETELLLMKATEGGFKARIEPGKDPRHDPVVVLTSTKNFYKVVVPRHLCHLPFKLGPFALKVGTAPRLTKFSLLWLPDDSDLSAPVQLLVQCHDQAPASAQLLITLNGDSRQLEPNGRCEWSEQFNAVGYEFPKHDGDARLSVTVLQTVDGKFPSKGTGPQYEPLDMETIQGRWRSDRLDMVFLIEGRDVILLNPKRATPEIAPEHFGTTGGQHFGKLQYGIGRHGWLRLHSYQMLWDGSTKDQLLWRQQNSESTITWTRSSPFI